MRILPFTIAACVLLGCGRPSHIPQESKELIATSQSLWTQIFNPRCVACHNPSGQARFLDLSSPEAVRAARNRQFGDEVLIDAARPENSYLVKVIEDPEEPMPPLSSGLPQLSMSELEILKQWIATEFSTP